VTNEYINGSYIQQKLCLYQRGIVTMIEKLLLNVSGCRVIEDSGCGRFIDIFDLNTLISHFGKPAIPGAKLIGRQIAAETIRPQRTMQINQHLALAQFLW
jgi:hypothetical protein